MSDIFQLRKEAFLLSQKNYVPGNPVYSKYSSIYIAPTGNVVDTMKLYPYAKKVLAVGGMGAFGFEAALNGAEKVDLFDINELQILFFEVVKTAITVFDHPTFLRHFTLEKQEYLMPVHFLKDLLSNEFFIKLFPFLPDDVVSVFGPLYSCFDSKELLLSSLFRFEHIVRTSYLKEFSSLYREEDYYKLQSILRTNSCDIHYQCASLTDLPKVTQEKYDLIILGNILQYYKKIKELSTPYDVHNFLHKKLSNLLTDDGVIQASYGFQIATDALKSKFSLPYTLYGKNDLERFLTQCTIEREVKNGINIPLAQKSDFYTYDFIPGVEKNCEHCENVIITYHNKARIRK